jgi:hypothetical protein
MEIKGVYRDILVGSDTHLAYDSGWVSNTIVDRCRVLLAGFMKNEPSDGIQYLAVGQGAAHWDSDGTPAPDPATAVTLEDGYDPPIAVADLDIVYLDDADMEVATPTSRLQITATLEPGYPAPSAPLISYPLREFGLFGRFNGTDYMINNVRHPVIHKDLSATLIRVIRLYF